jgi:lipopolysaccharide transport system ATP-binding protein
MSAAPVVFDNVWKKFRQGERHDSLRDLIPAVVRGLTSRKAGSELRDEEFWAIEDVSFEVPRGQALGIIGPNGAGKSTTLKLLTRILRPNRGRCALTGRVGALIEVAAGFHPDLTGRENTYLQGSIMGMKRAEVAARFDEIVDFAGVGQFIDTQVKRYSSGMHARLGFSIAAHLSPDVLIIDEVLSVGDMSFQDRCIQRMNEFKRKGVTIVFVSHNLQAVVELCDQALYLNRQARSIGPATEVIDKYVVDSFTSAEATRSEIHLVSSILRRTDGAPLTAPVGPGTTLNLCVEYDVVGDIDDVAFTFAVHRTTDQLLVYNQTFSQAALGLTTLPRGRFTVQFQFDANLTRGQYYFDVFSRHVPSLRYLGRLRPAGHLTIAENVTYGGVADLSVRASMAGSTHARRPEQSAVAV